MTETTSTTTNRAVRFDGYGGVDVLRVDDVGIPDLAEGRVLVRIRAAGINPGEASIRAGYLDSMFPSTFPSGEGSDLAGTVEAVAADVSAFAVGDEVLGWSEERSSHAQYAAVPATQLIPKPASISWEAAGSLYVVGATAYAAVRAVDSRPGETVAVSAAAGGVGSVVTQLLASRGVRVLGIASSSNAAWLTEHGAVPIEYGDGLKERLQESAPDGIDAFIDLHGPEYLHLAVDLGIDPQRVNTIIAFEEAGTLGTKAEGSSTASTTEVLSEMASLVADGTITIEVAATYPLDQVQQAFTELAAGHTRGKIVLLP
jgi:NADPH:quinone reductase-like Zn-dependent oxidoreductase